MSVPDQIGRYRILRALGTGAMAEVYLAELETFGGFRRKVALKVVKAEFAADEKFGQLLAREALIGSMLQHPNIVETLEFNQADGRMFLALEYVEGRTVEDLIEEAAGAGGAGLEMILGLEVMVQVLKGLAHAHDLRNEEDQALGIVHRDLKPGNVMVSRHGQVKVMDFGIAKARVASAALTAAGQVRGTPIYMAPEQVVGRTLDGRTDQFAAGTVLYEVLTGKKLFLARNLIEIMRAVSRAETAAAEEELAALHPELQPIAAKMWSLKPEDRYESCAGAADELEDLVFDLKQAQRSKRKRRRAARKAPPKEEKKGGMFDLVASLGLGRRASKNEPAEPVRRKRRRRKDAGASGPVPRPRRHASAATAKPPPTRKPSGGRQPIAEPRVPPPVIKPADSMLADEFDTAGDIAESLHAAKPVGGPNPSAELRIPKAGTSPTDSSSDLFANEFATEGKGTTVNKLKPVSGPAPQEPGPAVVAGASGVHVAAETAPAPTIDEELPPEANISDTRKALPIATEEEHEEAPDPDDVETLPTQRMEPNRDLLAAAQGLLKGPAPAPSSGPPTADPMAIPDPVVAPMELADQSFEDLDSDRLAAEVELLRASSEGRDSLLADFDSSDAAALSGDWLEDPVVGEASKPPPTRPAVAPAPPQPTAPAAASAPPKLVFEPLAATPPPKPGEPGPTRQMKVDPALRAALAAVARGEPVPDDLAAAPASAPAGAAVPGPTRQMAVDPALRAALQAELTKSRAAKAAKKKGQSSWGDEGPAGRATAADEPVATGDMDDFFFGDFDDP